VGASRIIRLFWFCFKNKPYSREGRTHRITLHLQQMCGHRVGKAVLLQAIEKKNQCVLLWRVSVWYTCAAVLCLLCYMTRRKMKDVIILQRKEVQVSATTVSHRKQSSTSAACSQLSIHCCFLHYPHKGEFSSALLVPNLYSHTVMSYEVCRWLPQVCYDLCGGKGRSF
jgi:hypothetical protein